MRILIVADDPTQRELTLRMLADRGLDVEGAGSLGEARERLRAGEFAAVVSDHELPDGSASEMFAQGVLDRASAIVVSARSEPDVPPGVRVLARPIPVDELLQLLGGILGEDLAPGTVRAGAHGDGHGHGGVHDHGDRSFVLYVSGDAPSCLAARRQLAALAERFGDLPEVEVVDLAARPERADPEDHVLFTPTLVRRRPLPRAWLVGDLSDGAALEHLLARGC